MKTPKEIALMAQEAVLSLRSLACDGDTAALGELWRIGMLAADELESLSMRECTKKAVARLARSKRSWPFKLAAVSEFRTGNTTSSPEAYSNWLGLGKNTGINLGNRIGASRKLSRKSPAGFCYYARITIEADLKKYGKLSDKEILKSFYDTWNIDRTAKPSKQTKANQKFLLEYIQAARAITNLYDERQWLKAAELWVLVVSEGNPNAPDVWPDTVYSRAAKNKRNVASVVSQWLTNEFSKIILRPSDK